MYLAEIFPQNFKGFGMACGAAANWAGIAAMTFVSLVSSNALIFSLFFGISLGASIFVLVCVRETKGLSIYGSPYFKEHVAMGKVLSQTFSLSLSLSLSHLCECASREISA